MCVYIYICVCVHMCVCMCECVCVCACVCMPLHIKVYGIFTLFTLCVFFSYITCNNHNTNFLSCSLSGGELFDRLVAEDYDLKESDCITYMRQICQGVQHMHRNNIIHLDLKVGVACSAFCFAVLCPCVQYGMMSKKLCFICQ